MKFISTRDKSKIVSASTAILNGISSDGGLYVPEYLPFIKDKLKDWQNLDYNTLAVEVLALYFDEFSKEALVEMVTKAYADKFSQNNKVALHSFDRFNFLELYHGPTAAFKDMALCLLPYLMKEAGKLQNDTRERIILTATSGDTGKAALEGFKDIKPYKVIVFYPETGVSPVQKQQMISLEGDNSYVVALKGNFDDAQNGVKKLFADKDFEIKLLEKNMVLSSANSINIGRLIPQIVYYFYGYFQMIKIGKINLGDKVDISVPTGNFGNILAAYLSKAMGLPIDNLICASNSNNVLTEFINKGVYNRKRNFHVTVAPSMDILVSSNLERYLHFVSDGDDILVKSLMDNLNTTGIYKLTENLKKEMTNIKAYSYSDDKILDEIKAVYDKEKYLMDTHTAIGYLAAKEDEKNPILIASTASPFKFTGSVAKALNLDGNFDEFQLIKDLEKHIGQSAPNCLKDLDKKPVMQNHNCEITQMKAVIEKILEV